MVPNLNGENFMNYEELADLVLPNIKTTPEDIEKRYPPRNLPEGAKVTRFAPSPTGFLHVGGLFGCLTDERLAHLSGGIVYLRIEDTDAKREVSGAAELFIENLNHYGIHFDEGAVVGGDKGDYGPYRQSERAEIYQTFAKQLIREGKAYPCFLTSEEIDEIRKQQEAQKLVPGVYGEWSKWRDASIDDVKEALAQKKEFVVRLRSTGDPSNHFKFTDMIKGTIDVTENNIDEVLLKSDGIPTYHFAHAVDDHLMGTTHVVRGDEWLPSLPKHIEIFKALGFRLPKYCHTAALLKMDGPDSKRKLSKRKDPEADVAFFTKEGYSAEALLEYLMTLLNSNFEDWRMANPTADIKEFPLSLKKMSVSGALFDIVKLYDVCKNVLCRKTAEEIYNETAEWAKTYSPEFYSVFTKNPDYSKAFMGIGRGGAKPRKDFGLYSEVQEYSGFMFDEYYNECGDYDERFDSQTIKGVLEEYLKVYDFNDEQQDWFEKIKDVSEKFGFARETKQYKATPEAFKGHVGDVSGFIRVAVTGKQNSPDMYLVMKTLGHDKVVERLNKQIERLSH